MTYNIFVEDLEYAKCMQCGGTYIAGETTMSMECTCKNQLVIIHEQDGHHIYAYDLQRVYICRKYKGVKPDDYSRWNKLLGIKSLASDPGVTGYNRYSTHLKQCFKLSKQITGTEFQQQEILENAMNHYATFLGESLKKLNYYRERRNIIDKKRIPGNRHAKENILMEILLFRGVKTPFYKDEMAINCRKVELREIINDRLGIDLHAALKNYKKKKMNDNLTLVDLLEYLIKNKARRYEDD